MKNKYMENERLSLVLFFSVAIMYAIIYMTKNCYSAAMVRLVEEGTLTKSQTGTINAVFYLVYGAFQIPGGIAADRFSPYKLIALGFFGATVSNALITVNDNYYFMMAVWAFNAVVQFGVWPAIFKLVSQALSPVHRHNGVFYITFASTLGLIMSYILAGAVSGWRMNFVVSAIALAVATLYWIVFGKIMDKKMVEEEPYHGNPHLPEAKVHDTEYTGSFAKLLISSGLVLVLPVVVLQSVFSLGIQAVAPSMFKESYNNISSSFASLLTIIPIVVGVVGKFMVKAIYRKKVYNECLFMAMCLALIIPIFGVMLFVGKISMWIIVVLVSLVVLIAAASGMLPFTYISVRFSKLGKGATVSGIINAMSALGIVVANYVSPRVADAFNNNWVPVILVWMAFALISAIISFIAFFPWRRFVKKTPDYVD